VANSFNDLSLIAFHSDTLRPQTFTSTGAGITVDVTGVGTNLLNARLTVGAVNTLTSLAVKIQASTDDSSWDDISGATFTTVTAANTSEIISFQMPTVTSVSQNPYKYVRAYATLVGTNAVLNCAIIACKKHPNPASGYKNQPPVGN
jgi:hypothetical protein